MELHNFIKIYLSNEKTIYNLLIVISDNTKAENEKKIQ